MATALLDALVDSWERNNRILVNLLRLTPDEHLDATPMDGSPSIGALFMHMHYVRLAFVEEDAPEFARPVPADEWRAEADRARMIDMLNDSCAAVRDAVTGRLAAGTAMARHYDHPILAFQHFIWHEGYHHGQIKLTLKQRGHPITDAAAGRETWGVWMDKS
jgi:uncharacterized damage-inducible protein DinB